MKLTVIFVVVFSAVVLASEPNDKPFWHTCDDCWAAWNECLLVSERPLNRFSLVSSSLALE
jgi:hypothetical protein